MPIDDLLAIGHSLKDVAMKISRTETHAERLGRAPRRVKRVAGLTIGLAPGSTRMLVRRAGAGSDALDFDLDDEAAFDERFGSLIAAIADNDRPDWVDDSLALAAGDLTAALQRAAPVVEFKVAGQPRRTFKTTEVRRETWRVVTLEGDEPISFVGRLYAVNLHTHRLSVQDDVGHQVALPKVLDDAAAGHLLGTYVTVSGRPERDAGGTLTHLHDATIEAGPDPTRYVGGQFVTSVDEILASAPGPDPGGGIELTDEEWANFMAAMGR